jgi:hypothetical protein
MLGLQFSDVFLVCVYRTIIYIYIVVHMYVFIFMNTSTLWMSCKNSSVVWNFHCSRKIL